MIVIVKVLSPRLLHRLLIRRLILLAADLPSLLLGDELRLRLVPTPGKDPFAIAPSSSPNTLREPPR